MSYIRTWIQCCEHQKQFHERSEAERENLGNEFHANFDRLHAKGDFVVLSTGKNCTFDEIFLFEAGTDAREFYERCFRDCERFPVDEVERFVFEEVSLYQGGERIATKSCEPSMPIEANHE